MKNERKSFYRVFLPMFLAFLLPFLIIAAASFALPAVFDDTFEGELSEKYDRLYSVGSPKVVVIAGSSAAYGLDSGLMEEKLGRKVVNFGLYANLGTKLMIDLSRDALAEGDIVILAPELNSWTYSLNFSPETTLQAFDGSFGMAKYLRGDDRSSAVGGLWSLAADKIYYHLSGMRPENVPMYQKKYFNEFGDSEFPRPYNIQKGYSNPIALDFFRSSDGNNTAEYDEFIDYVNDYVAFAEKKGATVWLSFPPMDEGCVALGSNDSMIDEFYTNLCQDLDCKVISNIRDYILDSGYFYDSEFHLNDSGVTIRTVQLIDDINRQLGINDVTMPIYELPAPAGYRPDCDTLTLAKTADGRGWTVLSLSDEGKKLRSVTIPDTVSGLPVFDISSGAFNDCENLVTLTLGKNVRSVSEGAVERSPKLSGLIIPEGVKPAAISLPESGLGDGCAESFKIYVSPADYEDYLSSSDPIIGKYRDIIVKNEDFIYRTVEGGFAVSGLSESGKLRDVLEIPAEHEGQPVTTIDENAFAGADNLSEIRLGSKVRVLEDDAFLGLNDVTLRLAKGIRPEDYARMPESFGQSGQLSIIADWELYGEYLESESFAACRSSLTCDNEYLLLEDCGGFWAVVGVNERAGGVTSITIPDLVDGLPVTTVAENAFSGADVEELTLGLSVQRLDGGALRGSNIRRLIVPDGVGADEISVPNNMSECLATDGCRDGLVILVDAELYGEFVGDYFWGDYAKYLAARE